MRSKHVALAIAVAALTGCTKTQHLTIGKFDPSSMQTSFAEEAPSMATYIVEIERPGKHNDVRVESTRVHVAEGTAMGFARTDSAVVAMVNDKQFELPAIPDDATLSWKAKRKVKTQFAKTMGKVGDAVLTGALDVGLAIAEEEVDRAVERGVEHAAKPHMHHRH